jgi:hypothetical protein
LELNPKNNFYLGFEVKKGDELRLQPRGCELQGEVRYVKESLEIPNT